MRGRRARGGEAPPAGNDETPSETAAGASGGGALVELPTDDFERRRRLYREGLGT